MSTPDTSDLFRALNEFICELPVPSADTVDLVCECPDVSCTRG